MRGFVWLSIASAALFGACVVGIEDVESKKPTNGTGGSSGNDGSVGGSGAGATGGANTGGASGNGGSETGGNGGTPNGGTGGTSATGGGGGSVSGGGTGGLNPCKNGMINVPSASGDYCVDSTEVTQAEYAKFLTGVAPAQTDPCSANAKLQPECAEYNPTLYPKRPVVCVDWCDARAYCTAAGKRLCGKIGGGNGEPGAILDASSNEWFRACSAGGVQKFPYGSLYGQGNCNDINAPTTSPVDVGSYAQCVGGYPDLYDMSGNVREWEATCNDNGCYARGGAYVDLQDNVACSAGVLTTRTAMTKELGFRCCAD